MSTEDKPRFDHTNAIRAALARQAAAAPTPKAKVIDVEALERRNRRLNSSEGVDTLWANLATDRDDGWERK